MNEPVSNCMPLAMHAERRHARFATKPESPRVVQHNVEEAINTLNTSVQAEMQRCPPNENPTLAAHDENLPQNKSLQPDSDDPVLVRENAVGRKRKRGNKEDSHQSKQIKVEVLSSSPPSQGAKPHTQGVQESMDLDEVPSNIYTPRKLQRRNEPIHNQYMGPARGDHIMEHENDPVVEDANEGPEHSFDEPLAISDGRDLEGVRNDAYYRERGREYALQLRAQDRSNGVDGMRAKQRLRQDRSLAKDTKISAGELHFEQRRTSDAPSGSANLHVLQPADINRILPRTGDAFKNRQRKNISGHRDHGARYIQCLAEDGENNQDIGYALTYPESRFGPSKSRESGMGTALPKDLDAGAQRQRLDTLLARPSPDKPNLQARDFAYEHAGVNGTFKAPLAVTVGEGQVKPVTPQPSNEIKKALKTSTKSMAAAFFSGRGNNDATPYARPKLASRDAPLRSRPSAQLSLNDFKINPKRNQGYDYAFKEVVRKHDQRKCLPGCTRPDCCGTIFRKMAEMGLAKPFHTTRLMGSSQDDEEESMLEDYLGDQAYRLRTMSKQERAEVLLQAKTKIFADHFGRHREVYAREPSPVGYWDVDMPSTQEAEELARQAEMRTRLKVDERYREAMRPDGIWKFRDE
ncbi:MAG: hypothetical protein Q9220_003071 [cf. Caloplaca sp. 1 TL-2023]